MLSDTSGGCPWLPLIVSFPLLISALQCSGEEACYCMPVYTSTRPCVCLAVRLPGFQRAQVPRQSRQWPCVRFVFPSSQNPYFLFVQEGTK
ncbi:hypothetical protein PF011_g19496 [Phytophthora fragariae]|uniref:Bifunctional inhibitor/plant lipid transfer protein/seed storage helical domain-containing protein n=1 Tax=Phytophthora fragariae TaxID=53985 RepID=A0A6A3IZS3_9STRA|nr:hypothetical protein PF011_g19496 [Phytophthora fragariae]